jgi:UDP-N-acetylmuramoylalanine--D-glutamate ligase
MATEVTNKSVAVLGGGVEGASSARWLLDQGAAVTIHDASDPSTLVSAKALQDAGATFVTGPDYLEGLERYDVIVRSPGIPFETHEVQAALAAGVPVTSQTKLFFERCPVSIIGITGTKGKGTTATLLHDMLKTAGETVHVGGNIGVPPLDFLAEIRPGHRVILELSSFQLQDLTQSPQVAVVTNLGSDHLDHHADQEEYAAAKENILRYQDGDDLAILNADDEGSRRFDSVGQGKRACFGRTAQLPPYASLDSHSQEVIVEVESRETVMRAAEIPIPGPHNLQNVMAASLAARLLGATPRQIAAAVRKFKPLPYHLEPLGTVNGVTYVNDSYSTSPTSTIPALESFEDPVILIAGGSDKGLDYSDLARELRARTKAVIVIPPAGDRIARAVQESDDGPEIRVAAAPEEVFPILAELAHAGDTVLLSPAAASFGWFDNYRERGAWFSREVAKLEQ